MKPFMDEDFLLSNETAKKLYHDHAEKMPVFDFHNHLNVQEIYEDRKFDNIAKVWLSGDHYKWRALRANGIDEERITGEASWKEKYDAWAKTVPETFGNPLYHWTHLELKRYFGIHKTLSPETGEEIYQVCNEYLEKDEYSVRNLLRKMNVKALCTTDDPADDLKYHRLLKEEGFDITVLPTFRPDRVLNPSKPDFTEYIGKLSQSAGMSIHTLDELLEALDKRACYFGEIGCRVSDHGLDGDIYEPCSRDRAEEVFHKALEKKPLTSQEIRQYRGCVLTALGRIYSRLSWVMQLHIGAVRNNSRRMFEKLGPDTGFDSIDDPVYAKQLNGLLSGMDYTGDLPKTILYCLSSKDFEMLASLAGNFQDGSLKGKIQLGAAWWFLDQKRGMEAQLDVLSQIGLLSGFVGMLTDSRSFLSFPRHEYFRRILCNYVGQVVENGEYPKDYGFLGRMIENICYYNGVSYFDIEADLGLNHKKV